MPHLEHAPSIAVTTEMSIDTAVCACVRVCVCVCARGTQVHGHLDTQMRYQPQYLYL